MRNTSVALVSASPSNSRTLALIRIHILIAIRILAPPGGWHPYATELYTARKYSYLNEIVHFLIYY